VEVRRGNGGYAAVPEELRAQDQWVCWRYIERDGKRVKVPASPVTGQEIDYPKPEY
jgi:primase-polymerase (primpol)-like protein